MSLADYVVAYDKAIANRDVSEQYKIEDTVRRWGVTRPILIMLVEAQKTNKTTGRQT